MKKGILLSLFLFIAWIGRAQDSTSLLSSEYGIVNFGETDSRYFCDDGHIDDQGNHVVLYQKEMTLGIAYFNSAFEMQWAKEIGSNEEFGIGNLLALSTGNYFVASGEQILSFTAKGKILWQKKLPEGSYQVRTCAEMSNGNLLIAGQYWAKNFVMILKPDGSIVKSYESISLITDLCPAADGNMLLLGFLHTYGLSSADKGGIVLSKIKPDGTQLWQKTMIYDNENNVNYYNSILEASNGDIYVTGRTVKPNNTNFNTSDLLVLKFDSKGTYQKGRTYGYVFDDSGYDMIEDIEGNLIVVGFSMTRRSCGGSLMVLRLCPELELIYVKNFGEAQRSGAFYKHLKQKGDMIYAYGSGSLFSSISNAGADGNLLKTDLNFGFHCVNYYKDIEVSKAPEYTEVEPYTNLKWGLFPFDEYKNEREASTINAEVFCAPTSIAETLPENNPCTSNPLTLLSVEEATMTLFPNPASTALYIELPQNALGHSVRIIDFTGKEVLTQQINQSTALQIDISQLPVGGYLLQVQLPNGMNSARFTKM